MEFEANTASFQALACELARRPSMSQLAAIVAQTLGADSAWLGIEVASGQLVPVTSYGIALPAVVIPGQCPASLGRESFSLGFTDPTGVIAVNFSKTRLADDHEIFQAIEAVANYAASLIKLNAQNARILALLEIPKALLGAFSASEACQIVIGVVLDCTGARAGGIVSAGNLYKVNEHGKGEFFNDPMGGQYFMPVNNGTISTSGGGDKVNVMFNVVNQVPGVDFSVTGTQQNGNDVVINAAVRAVAGQIASGIGEVPKAMSSRGITGNVRR